MAWINMSVSIRQVCTEMVSNVFGTHLPCAFRHVTTFSGSMGAQHMILKVPQFSEHPRLKQGDILENMAASDLSSVTKQGNSESPIESRSPDTQSYPQSTRLQVILEIKVLH